MRRVLVVLMAALLAGCGSADGDGGLAIEEPPPTSSGETSIPTTTLDPEEATKAEIVEAYRQSWDAFIAVGSDPEGQLDDPRLSERMRGSALAAAQLSIRKWRADGHVLDSIRLEVNPRVVELGPDTAVLEDCLIDVSGLVDEDTGQVIEPPGPPELALATVTYELVNGKWMQNSFTDEERPCVLPES